MNTATQILTDNKLQNTFWGKKIVAAEKRTYFTLSNLSDALKWTICACGENTKQSMRECALCANDAQSDKKLRKLGEKFYQQVIGGRNEGRYRNKERIVEAARTLVAIESRVTQLLLKKKPINRNRERYHHV